MDVEEDGREFPNQEIRGTIKQEGLHREQESDRASSAVKHEANPLGLDVLQADTKVPNEIAGCESRQSSFPQRESIKGVLDKGGRGIQDEKEGERRRNN